MKAPGVIYRLGRKPDPWSPPDWASAGPDGTFGNRFDDPDATYRVLYASSQRFGCFVETLARFRVDPKLHRGLGCTGVPPSAKRGTSPPTPLGFNSNTSLETMVERSLFRTHRSSVSNNFNGCRGTAKHWKVRTKTKGSWMIG